MKKKLILTALLAIICGCQNQSDDSHKRCTEDKCRAESQTDSKIRVEEVVEKQASAVEAAPAVNVDVATVEAVAKTEAKSGE
jgi:uncharacterized lipoprotein NlpE involved in copper resistance